MAPRAALRVLLPLLLLPLLLVGTSVLAQDDDLNLWDALPGGEDKQKPTPKPGPGKRTTPKPGPGDDLNLSDALDGRGHGGFSDSDLVDGHSGGDGGGGGSPRHDGEARGDIPGMISGIVGAVVVALAGAVSSFIAYQKKKFCFKDNAEQGDVHMQTYQRANAEPPVQQTIVHT